MSSDLDEEIEAIRTVLAALEPLKPEGRDSVVEYVFKRLGMQPRAPEAERTPSAPSPPATHPPPPNTEHVHIKNMKEERQPKSAIEMAVLVAYYLGHVAPQSDRKSTIATKDLDTYFKIAEFKPPTRQEFTLPNAKNAGYFDSAGTGQYKLNPVGYNLVVHSMPRTAKAATSTQRKSKTKKRKTPSKKKPSSRKKKAMKPK